MKRVVTGVRKTGRSFIVSVDELDSSSNQTVWSYDPKDLEETITAIDPTATADWIAPQMSGGAVWYYTPMPPATETRHVQYPGHDESGFHTTRTIDFDLVCQGTLTLVLDDDEIVLGPGDYVIQQATRHAWRNDSDQIAVLLALLHRPMTI